MRWNQNNNNMGAVKSLLSAAEYYGSYYPQGSENSG